MGRRLSLGTGTEGLSMFTVSKKVPQIQNCLQTFAHDSLRQGMKQKMLLQKVSTSCFNVLLTCVMESLSSQVIQHYFI